MNIEMGEWITRPVITMWVIVAVVAVFSILATRRLKEVPGPLQSAAEMAVGALRKFFAGILGEKNVDRYLPLMGTFFIFIVVCNYTGLLPGAGIVFDVPTASLSVTAGLAVIGFAVTQAEGVRVRGLGGYLKTFAQPLFLCFLMLPLNLIEQFVHPVSLALRLYGNLSGEELAAEQLGGLAAVGLPIVMHLLSLIFCLIQAIVFTMLVSIYITEAIGEEE
ncbi:MAG: F0F1 ATP synthase subunit A [Lentisphaeria bacterium]|nr:F0F1 ATP synthase subunit A [Lentisphaeria bacterium]